MKPHFIYIHGFNSSPDSLKARLMVTEFERLGFVDRLTIPALSHWPTHAIRELETLVLKHDQVVLIGSSLGGFYATYLTERHQHVRAVLVNPAVAPQRLLSDYLGPQKNYYSGESYQLTWDHMTQLEALYVPHLNHPERVLLMQQEGDETLDYRDAIAYYAQAQQIVQPGGHHGFENFESMLPTIFEFAAKDIS